MKILIKSILNASLVMLIYKPIVTALRRAGAIKASKVSSGYTFDKKSLAVIISALAIMTISLLIFFVAMGANVEWFGAFNK